MLVLAMLKVDCKSPPAMRLAMDEEIQHAAWRKAIPVERDRLQSRILVCTAAPVLAALCLHSFALSRGLASESPAYVFAAVATSIAFAAVALALRAATPGGAACGGMICLLLTFCRGSLSGSVLRTGLSPLILLFVLTFVATRLGKQRKLRIGLAEARHGRSAAQVIANLGVAALAASLNATPQVTTLALAALVEATADTVSSEIGQAFGEQPVLLTTMRRVEPGTDGAISILGTAAGVVGGTLVAVAGLWALRLHPIDAAIALAGGVAGLLFDSLLGATVERSGRIGNDLVNFASTLFAAVTAAVLFLALR
jgi:uncharacterized protein (TIGR00297 family)